MTQGYNKDRNNGGDNSSYHHYFFYYDDYYHALLLRHCVKLGRESPASKSQTYRRTGTTYATTTTDLKETKTNCRSV